jgi:multimeric flavodoxin WrbA
MNQKAMEGGREMKVIAFNGSARKNGNTAMLINYALRELEAEGIETELVQFAGKKISGCIACYKCMELKDGTCAVKNDPVNEWIDKMKAADAVILGSPVYFADLTAGIKGFIERAGMASRAGGDLLKRKIGASVVTMRRAGAIHTFDSMNHFFLITQMIIVGANYWNTGIGRNIGEVEDDTEGIETMRVLGRNMAWLLKELHT